MNGATILYFMLNFPYPTVTVHITSP